MNSPEKPKNDSIILIQSPTMSENVALSDKKTDFEMTQDLKGIELYLDPYDKNESLKKIVCGEEEPKNIELKDKLIKYFNMESSQLRMLIVVTMYNEPEKLLRQTLKGIYRNLKNFKSIGISEEQVAVVVIIDGMFLVHESVRTFLATISPKNETEISFEKKRRMLIYDFQCVMILHEIMGRFEHEKYRKELDEFYASGLEVLRTLIKNYEYSVESHKKMLLQIITGLKSIVRKRVFELKKEEFLGKSKDSFQSAQEKALNKLDISARRLLIALKEDMEKDTFIGENLTFTVIQMQSLNISNLAPLKKFQKAEASLRKYWESLEAGLNSNTGYISCCDQEMSFNFHLFLNHSEYAKSVFSVPSKATNSDMYAMDAYLNSLLNHERMKIGISGHTSILYQLSAGPNFLSNKKNKNKNPMKPNNKTDEVLLNLFFNIKVKNKRKLNSHLWFFKGFCKYWNPDYCCLIDCGTVPHESGLVNFFKEFEKNDNVGGLCGSMGIRLKGKPMRASKGDLQSCLQSVEKNVYRFLEFIFPISRTQKFEYSLNHILDKSFESCFGFIHVLPGAWSAYRWKALNDNGILEDKYLASTRDNYEAKSVYEINMLLAEDRILCLALFSKPRNNYQLRYVPNAFAETDPVTDLHELFNQRRRWINGSWYALNYVLHFKNDVEDSSHSLFQKFLFNFSLLYSYFNMIICYLSLGINLISVKISFEIQFSKYKVFESNKTSLSGLLFTLYLALLLMILFICMQAKPKDIGDPRSSYIRRLLQRATHILGLYTLSIYALIFYILMNNYFGESSFSFQNYVWFCLLTNVSCFFFLIILNPSHLCAMGRNFISYIYYAPTYINSFVLFSFCNIDDFSWGTKGNYEVEKKKSEFLKEVKNYKVTYVAEWIAVNAVLVYALDILNSIQSYHNILVPAFSLFFTANISFKTVFAMLQITRYRFKQLVDFLGWKFFLFDYEKRFQKYSETSQKCKEAFKEFINKSSSSNQEPDAKNGMLNQNLAVSQEFEVKQEVMDNIFLTAEETDQLKIKSEST